MCTGTIGNYWVAKEPNIKYKYGYHFIWPSILVTEQQHRQILDFIIQHFKQLETQEVLDAHTLRELRTFNEWQEIFDTTIMDNFSGLRMLYTIKSFTCKLCEKLSDGKKKSNSKKVVYDKECPSCFGTGMLDKRYELDSIRMLVEKVVLYLIHKKLLREKKLRRSLVYQIKIISRF